MLLGTPLSALTSVLGCCQERPDCPPTRSLPAVLLLWDVPDGRRWTERARARTVAALLTTAHSRTLVLNVLVWRLVPSKWKLFEGGRLPDSPASSGLGALEVGGPLGGALLGREQCYERRFSGHLRPRSTAQRLCHGSTRRAASPFCLPSLFASTWPGG